MGASVDQNMVHHSYHLKLNGSNVVGLLGGTIKPVIDRIVNRCRQDGFFYWDDFD